MALYDNRYGNVGGTPEQAQERKQLAQRLLLNSQEPLQGQTVSGIYVAPSWTQQLAKLLQGVQAKSEMNAADKQMTDYNTQKQKTIADILSGQKPQTVTDTKQEQYLPAYEPSQMDRFGSPTQPREMQTRTIESQRAETPEEVQARLRPLIYQAASQYGNDPALQLALGDLNYSRQRADTRSDLQEGRTYQESREAVKRQQQLDDVANQQEFQRILMKEQQGFQTTQQEKQFAQQYQMMKAQQGFQAQQQANQQKFTAGQNAIARQQAIDVAQAKNMVPQTQKQNDANEVLGILQQAAPLINTSTGSGIGSIVDATQGFFGGTNKGAIASSQLKALEGLLVSKMPKMSGPQSDKDVLLYKQMAGQIGDPTIPAPQKRAAMETINTLNAKYLGIEPPNLNFDNSSALQGLSVNQDLISQELKRRGLK